MTTNHVTVAIRRDTKTRLDDAGKKGETYDQIIKKLLSKVRH